MKKLAVFMLAALFAVMMTFMAYGSEQKQPSLFTWMEEGIYSYDIIWLNDEFGEIAGSYTFENDNWVVTQTIHDSLNLRLIFMNGHLFYVFDEYSDHSWFYEVPWFARNIIISEIFFGFDGGWERLGLEKGYAEFNGKLLQYVDEGYGENGEILRWLFNEDGEVYGYEYRSKHDSQIISRALIKNAANTIPEGIFDIPEHYREEWISWVWLFEDMGLPIPAALTTADALTALRVAEGLEIITAEQKSWLDIDGDGIITEADALEILKIVAFEKRYF
jgi:hypothetical protein